MSIEAAPPRSVLYDGTRVPALAAVASAALATAVVLSGVGGTGHRLVRDFVAVPDPVAPSSLLPTSASQLRAWPLDAVTWAVAAVLPTSVQQVVILVVALLLAGTGTGLLVAMSVLGQADPRVVGRGDQVGVGPAAAAAAAAWVAVWNPYVVERLLLGHAPTLLGYACLPWIVLVARSTLRTRSRMVLLVVVAMPAALTPWGGVVALVSAVLADVSRPDRRPGRTALVAGVGVGWCLPWVVPAVLVGGVAADADGPAAFALADDSGLGTWLSALMGGGVWATGAQPESRTDPVSLTASLVLVALAFSAVVGLVAGSVTKGRHGGTAARRRSPGGSPALSRAAAAALLVVAPATLAWWASGPGLDAMAALQAVPGAAIFRDQHRMLAPAVLAQGVLVAAVVAWLGRHGGRLAATLGCGVVVALTIASVPDLPREMRTAYRPVSYPGEWDAVISSLHSGVAEPTTVSLPWQPLRRPAWAGDPPFLDPLPRAVRGEVLVSTALTVLRDGGTVVVDDSPLEQTWATGEVSTESLRQHGATHVVEWLGTPGALASSHDGWSLLHSGADFRVWDVSGAR